MSFPDSEPEINSLMEQHLAYCDKGKRSVS